MAILPDPSKNFINALSSFWNAFFVDADELRAYYDGVQINLGQIYLEMLQTVLGTSLKDMPLFSRYYFKYLEVSRSSLYYIEGASPSEDLYAYTPSDFTLAGIDTLTNRVLAPTATLMRQLDFVVSGGAVRFRRDVFDVDGAGTAEPLFPVRSVQEVAPATFTEPSGADWRAQGVRVGDFFRLRVLGRGSPVYTRVTGVEGSVLYLAESLPEFSQSFSSRRAMVSVMRTPYDAERVGVMLPAHPSGVAPFAPTGASGRTLPGTKTVTIASEPFYRAAWAPLTAYNEGDVVEYSAALYRAKAAHSSTTAFDPMLWVSLPGSYVFVSADENPKNSGLCRCVSTTGPILLLDRADDFTPTPTNKAVLTLVLYAGTYAAGAKPSVLLPQTFIEPGTLYVVAKRGHDAYVVAPDGTPTTLLAGYSVVEGLDYVVNYETGEITFLTGWYPPIPARANYTWAREIVSYTYITPSATLFTFDVNHTVQRMAFWGTDVQADEEGLFNNFGYLLDFRRPTSEQYRTFLRGVAQLFMLGPALERFESAMNVMAEFPVVRDDGEVLLGYDSGLAATGSAGSLIDTAQGRDGTLSASAATFSSPTANFFETDLGARLLILNGGVYDAYTVTEVLSSTTARITPAPPSSSPCVWNYQHVALTSRFRDAGGVYLFQPEDTDGTIIVSGSNYSRNNGAFRIVAVDNPTTVVLETPYGFDDETGLTWSVSRTNKQTVTTTRAAYDFPLRVAMRTDVKDPANFGYLKLRAFESLTEAFLVIDYVRDPTWWHDVVIPDDVLQLETEGTARRRVSTAFIPHVFNALDAATFGDLGMAYGVDDEATPGQQRRGPAIWFGANSVQLTYPAGVPMARNLDVGQCLLIRTPHFEGSYPILGVSSPGSGVDHTVLTLDRFPPPGAALEVPPVTLDVELPPLLYRRTVAFVMMDRFLKYHAVQIRIDKDTPVPPGFIPDVLRLVTEAKPSHTYIYLNTLTEFEDSLRVLEEPVRLDLGLPLGESLFGVDNVLRYGLTDGVRYGDAFRYVDAPSITISTTPGSVTTLPFAALSGDVEYSLVKVRFDEATRVNGGLRRPAEGVDYLVDYSSGKVAIDSLASFTAGTALLHYVYCARRIRLDTDPLDPEETRLAYGSTNPGIYRAPTQAPWQMGLVDRAVQITLGP
jgi:hypothetical protein